MHANGKEKKIEYCEHNHAQVTRYYDYDHQNLCTLRRVQPVSLLMFKGFFALRQVSCMFTCFAIFFVLHSDKVVPEVFPVGVFSLCRIRWHALLDGDL